MSQDVVLQEWHETQYNGVDYELHLVNFVVDMLAQVTGCCPTGME